MEYRYLPIAVQPSEWRTNEPPHSTPVGLLCCAVLCCRSAKQSERNEPVRAARYPVPCGISRAVRDIPCRVGYRAVWETAPCGATSASLLQCAGYRAWSGGRRSGASIRTHRGRHGSESAGIDFSGLLCTIASHPFGSAVCLFVCFPPASEVQRVSNMVRTAQRPIRAQQGCGGTAHSA